MTVIQTTTAKKRNDWEKKCLGLGRTDGRTERTKEEPLISGAWVSLG